MVAISGSEGGKPGRYAGFSLLHLDAAFTHWALESIFRSEL